MPRPLLRCLLLLATASAAGCGSEPPVEAGSPKPDAPAAPTAFRRADCGSVSGFVTWVGPIPTVPPATRVVLRPDGSAVDSYPVKLANAPRIDFATRGLAGAVVFLHGIDPDRARPWDLKAVIVEFSDGQIAVKQDGRTDRTGFVPRGQEVTLRSAEPDIQVLRGRGAAFFAVPFPDPGKERKRKFDACGRIELTSGSGSYWQSADLFVCDHPYYAVTDKLGRFEFPLVPAGRYDLVAWHPNWEVARTDRNPESCLPHTLHFAPPLESSRPIVVVAGPHPTLANLTLPK